MKKKKVIKILLSVILLIIVAATVAYIVYEPEKPGLAFYIACCAGVLVLNLILSVIFINKNFKE